MDETAPVPGHPDAVGLVDDEQGAMAVADLDEVAQGRGIAQDRVDRLDGDDDPPVGAGGQFDVEGHRVVVREGGVRHARHASGVVQRRMGVGVEEDLSPATTECGQHSEVGGIPGGEGERARLPGQPAEGGLEVPVHRQRPGHQTAGGRRRAIAVEGLVSRSHDALVPREAKVVVRGEVKGVAGSVAPTAQAQDGVEAFHASSGPEVGPLRQPGVPVAHPCTSATAPTIAAAVSRTSSSVQM